MRARGGPIACPDDSAIVRGADRRSWGLLVNDMERAIAANRAAGLEMAWIVVALGRPAMAIGVVPFEVAGNAAAAIRIAVDAISADGCFADDDEYGCLLRSANGRYTANVVRLYR